MYLYLITPIGLEKEFKNFDNNDFVLFKKENKRRRKRKKYYGSFYCHSKKKIRH